MHLCHLVLGWYSSVSISRPDVLVEPAAALALFSECEMFSWHIRDGEIQLMSVCSLDLFSTLTQ